MLKSALKKAEGLIAIDSNFQKLARRPGGIPRDRAIENAQVALVQMRSATDSWIDEGMSELLQAALRTKLCTPADAASAKSLYSAACRLRDIGTTAGFDLITSIAANLCELLKAIEGGAVYRHDVVDCHVAALRMARQERYRDVRTSDIPDFIEGLRSLVKTAMRPTSASESAGSTPKSR